MRCTIGLKPIRRDELDRSKLPQHNATGTQPGYSASLAMMRLKQLKAGPTAESQKALGNRNQRT